jgi:hypothetical protein
MDLAYAMMAVVGILATLIIYRLIKQSRRGGGGHISNFRTGEVD